MTYEQMFEKPCLDSQTTATFPAGGDATCPGCGLRMYLTDGGQVGRYPAANWEPGGIQGRRRSEGTQEPDDLHGGQHLMQC
jgi:hypothetical protein